MMRSDCHLNLTIQLFLVANLVLSCQTNSIHDSARDLIIEFKGEAQIEIGGPFTGIEMHHGSPLLNRISFYYPVANSIDLSKDYWSRDQSRIMFLALKIGNQSDRWFDFDSFNYQLTPFFVEFYKQHEDISLDIA
ncbi:MAG: hypothetical protein ACE5HX_03685, partial [bacterium]